VFAILNSGGAFMYVILLVSITAFAICCERAAFLFFKLNLNIDTAYSKIATLLEKMNYKGALDECGKIDSHPLGRILKAGLLKADKRDKEIELVMEESIMREIGVVKARINYLTLFANIATLLGLLGTILGLITAFKGVSNANAAMKQEILASGISVAMLTTAFGLIVAIPCLVAYYILNNRGESIIGQFEEKALALYTLLTSMKREEKE
jgi:biopolymer transport protein ExbB/TolQ